MGRSDGSARGSGLRQGHEERDDEARTPPALINMVAEDIEGLPGARNQGHRCLPTKAGRSEQWCNVVPSLGDLSMGNMAQVRHALSASVPW